jgi:hypothetical protein
MSQRARHWALLVKRDVHAIYCAARDPRVPWYAKALAICVAGYALSPIDLIPDFVPILGYIDYGGTSGVSSSDAGSGRESYRRNCDRHRLDSMYRTCGMDLLSLFRELSSRLDQWPPERGAVRSIKIMI